MPSDEVESTIRALEHQRSHSTLYSIEMLFVQLLANPITVDLKMNRMECFFAMVELPSELAGTYSIQTDGDFNFSYRLSSNKANHIFESPKISA